MFVLKQLGLICMDYYLIEINRHLVSLWIQNINIMTSMWVPIEKHVYRAGSFITYSWLGILVWSVYYVFNDLLYVAVVCQKVYCEFLPVSQSDLMGKTLCLCYYWFSCINRNFIYCLFTCIAVVFDRLNFRLFFIPFLLCFKCMGDLLVAFLWLTAF